MNPSGKGWAAALLGALATLLLLAVAGLIVVYGRLQPIVTTIATGAVYYGVALALRPVPGGDFDAALGDALTGNRLGLRRSVHVDAANLHGAAGWL